MQDIDINQTDSEKMWESEFQEKVDGLLFDALVCFRLTLKYDDCYVDMLTPKIRSHLREDRARLISPFQHLLDEIVGEMKRRPSYVAD